MKCKQCGIEGERSGRYGGYCTVSCLKAAAITLWNEYCRVVRLIREDEKNTA